MPQPSETNASMDLSQRRHLDLDGAFNFRDLGGYSTTSGRKVAWRKLFRSDDLFRLSEADLVLFSDLGIKTVIDLRTKAEANQRGRFPLESYKLEYYQRSLLDISADHSKAVGKGANDYIFTRYTQILSEGATGIRDVFNRLSEGRSLPAVFHCAVGKDRTGLIAAIMLEVLDVTREQVLQDYALTQNSIESLLSWLDREAPHLAEQIRTLPAVVMSANPENLDRVLNWVDSTYGSVTNYLLAIGVTKDRTIALREQLLES